MDIPVYLFTGFLEAGKTKDRTLVLLCEEGEEELSPAQFASPDVFIEVIDDRKRINPDKLEALRRKHNATRVMIEYNGMWLVNDLFRFMPEDWAVYQEFMFVDDTTIDVYNANMRNLVVDKLSSCDIVVFNRCTPDTDFQARHQLVRTISRRADIVYERTDGQIAYDDIEDPLPFDIDAPVIEIGDGDYALFYRDLCENTMQYNGKTVTFLGRVNKNSRLPARSFFVGRPIMTCCVEDIQYCGLLCEDGGDSVKDTDWVRISAKITVKHSRIYGRKGPVLKLISLTPDNAPENPVATFF